MDKQYKFKSLLRIFNKNFNYTFLIKILISSIVKIKMNKFEDLLSRFEGLLNRFEGTESAPCAKPSGVDDTTGKAAGPAAPRLPKVVKDFDSAVQESLDKFLDLGSKHTSKVIQDLSVVVKDQFKMMRDIVHAISISKKEKPEDMAAEISVIFKSLDDRVFKLGKDMVHKNHSKVMHDGLQLINLLIMDDPVEMGKEYLAQMDFFGNKILTSQVDADMEW